MIWGERRGLREAWHSTRWQDVQYATGCILTPVGILLALVAAGLAYVLPSPLKIVGGIVFIVAFAGTFLTEVAFYVKLLINRASARTHHDA